MNNLSGTRDKLRHFFLSIFLLLIPFEIFGNEHIIISDPWIAEAPPTAATHAGYLTIDNRGPLPLTILSVTSPLFSRIEIHQSVTANNVTRMTHHQALEIPARSSVVFKAGGFHLMLYNAGRVLETGTTVPMTVYFSDNSSVEVKAPVRKLFEQAKEPDDTGQTINRSRETSSIMTTYQHFLPHHLLSGMMYHLTRVTWRPVKNLMINGFIRHFGVDMSIAEKSDADLFIHFNAFFTRALKPEARPVDLSHNAVVSPVDGTISQVGQVSEGRLVQAKGMTYTLSDLLGGNAELAGKFDKGEFITLYLAPRDYHRVHMPVTGKLMSMTYVPGKLLSVNQATTNTVDNLFARNERLITVFHTDAGSMALIMVGAIFVGSMETVWAGEVTPAQVREPSSTIYAGMSNAIHIPKGEEMGRFNMGSTVILLFEKGKLTWEKQISADAGVRMGKKIGELIKTGN